ncbi:MAG: hypothetical protein AAGC86_09560, partial [Pseudomonadota bacterium]
FEFFIAKRTVPHFSNDIDLCELPRVTHDAQPFLQFLGDNEQRIILLDMLMVNDTCWDEGSLITVRDEFPDQYTVDLGTDERYRPCSDLIQENCYSRHDSKTWPTTLTIDNRKIDESILGQASFGDDNGIQLYRGIVYVANFGTEGLNEYQLTPVPFDFQAERVSRCTMAIKEKHGFSKLAAYLTNCVTS